MVWKTLIQKRREGRESLKSVFVTPFVVASLCAILIYLFSLATIRPDIYQLHTLPPLSKSGKWGIFNPSSKAGYIMGSGK